MAKKNGTCRITVCTKGGTWAVYGRVSAVDAEEAITAFRSACSYVDKRGSVSIPNTTGIVIYQGSEIVSLEAAPE